MDKKFMFCKIISEGSSRWWKYRAEGREVERFTDLTVGEVLAMFPTSPSAVFRPPNPADFELYDRKLRTKPF